MGVHQRELFWELAPTAVPTSCGGTSKGTVLGARSNVVPISCGVQQRGLFWELGPTVVPISCGGTSKGTVLGARSNSGTYLLWGYIKGDCSGS